MQSKKSLILKLFIAGISIAIAQFGASLYFKTPPAKIPTQIIEKLMEPFVFPKEAIFSLPVRLRIPIINVDAPVEYVGIAADGAMAVPKGSEEVAWYEPGPRPGESGSAVMAGHYGYKDNKPAVFDGLYKLRKGDKVYVEDEKGIVTTFIVRETRNYDPKADATYIFSSNDGMAHFNLITCEGVWNKDQKSYSKRLVVFTDKE
jgi:sortase A